MKLTEIHPRLFIRGHTIGLNQDNLLHALGWHCIVAVVNVALRPDPVAEQTLTAVGISYLHEPLSDSRDPGRLPVARIRSIASQVHSYMMEGPVIVHCDSGWNRSAMVGILALAEYTGDDPSFLIEQARKQRPKILKNKTFEAFVCGRGAHQLPLDIEGR